MLSSFPQDKTFQKKCEVPVYDKKDFLNSTGVAICYVQHIWIAALLN